jgi:hypothetical protein
MGARESRPTGDNAGTTTEPAVEDYYGLLEVEESATSDEIKVCILLCNIYQQCRSKLCPRSLQRSFRRLALVHHPDKNRDDPEGATNKFAAIQRAYEVAFNLTVAKYSSNLISMNKVLSDDQVCAFVIEMYRRLFDINPGEGTFMVRRTSCIACT